MSITLTPADNTMIKFTNCCIVRDRTIIREDLWVRRGKIVNPQAVFFSEKRLPDVVVDCWGALIAPGFIDLQINGGFGVDFTHEVDKVEEAVSKVAKGITAHGVTSFLPTLVSSTPDVYKAILPKLRKRVGGAEGAGVLGVHLEGPFISPLRKGAHDEKVLQTFPDGYKTLQDTYGPMRNVAIVTLAPEIPNALEVIDKLKTEKIVVSIGHSNADISTGEKAIQRGATLMTHLFNAMSYFHHRDPGLLGLIALTNIPQIYFGLIADGLHTHPAALRIAYKTNPEGCVIVTDAISALGLPEGTHTLGQSAVDVKNGVAYISGTDILCGSITTFNNSVKFFRKATGCSLVEALEAGSLHPARVLKIDKNKGTLNYGADADFIMLNDNLDVIQTWVGGKCAFKNSEIEDYISTYNINASKVNLDSDSSEAQPPKQVYFNIEPYNES